ncbi:hypothetical protein Taro_031761 [Colocasia esculenta]|uniref:Late embryogenesis abundant protein LEA-2 subgroup domain-containing protein n=1 Tax=Colocasia esculenta TaxID=4460 RepID=A0A843VVH3_COLES|nr:hypothetical protein [Colocasia esculenta]
MAEEKEQVMPLANSAATVYPAVPLDEEGADRWRSGEYLRKRRCFLFCCGCCSALVVVLGLVLLVLALTVFRVKDPQLIMNSIHVDGISHGERAPGGSVSVNMTLTADVDVKNPNVASYKFQDSTTEFYYRGETVGVAYVPGGEVKAGRTARMNATVHVMTDRVAARLSDNMTWDSWLRAAGRETVNLTSHTEISGRVNLFGVFRRDLDVFLNCSMTLDLSLDSQDVKNKTCWVKAQ